MKSPYCLTKFYIMTALLLSSFLIRASFGQTLITNEYWISPSTNTANIGTLNDPFDGSTASKFDSALAALPAGSAIHILAGTYQTEGDFGPFHLKSNDKIIGSGEDVTIVQLASNATDNAFVMTDYGQLGGMDTNITVEDLTLDGNYQGGTKTFHGLSLNGPNMTAKDLKVINLAYFDDTVSIDSALGISLAGPNALIEHCLIDNFRGGYNNALIAFSISAASAGGAGPSYPGSGIIRNNTLISTNNTDSCIGVAVSFSNGVLIDGNNINGADTGISNGSSTNATIVNNIFANVRFGLYTGTTTHMNYIFDNNTVMLTTNFLSDGAVALSLGGGCTNWSITGNVGGWTSPTQSGDIGYFIALGNDEQGILVANNRVDASFQEYVVTNGYTAYGNYDLTGNWLTNLQQTPF